MLKRTITISTVLAITLSLTSCSLFGGDKIETKTDTPTPVSDFGLKTKDNETKNTSSGSTNGSLSASGTSLSGSTSGTGSIKTSTGISIDNIGKDTLTGSTSPTNSGSVVLGNSGAILNTSNPPSLPFVENGAVAASGTTNIQGQIVEKRLETMDRLLVEGLKAKATGKPAEAKLSLEGAVNQIATLSGVLVSPTDLPLKMALAKIDSGLKLMISGIVQNDNAKYDSGIVSIKEGIIEKAKITALTNTSISTK